MGTCTRQSNASCLDTASARTSLAHAAVDVVVAAVAVVGEVAAVAVVAVDSAAAVVVEECKSCGPRVLQAGELWLPCSKWS